LGSILYNYEDRECYFRESWREKNCLQENAVRRITELLRDNKTVVIDEFQRINPEYMGLIALEHPNGRLIASGSSFKLF